MQKNWNWRLWTGFIVALFAPSALFALYDTVPGAFWISVAGLVVGIVLLVSGVRRAFAQPDSYRGKVAGPILATLTLLVIAAFTFGSYMMRQAYSQARNAPRVGDKAPEFALTDGSGRKVTMAQLFATPLVGGAARAPRGVLLVFYRGYWWGTCVSELRSIQRSLGSLSQLGVQPVAISADSPNEITNMCQKAGITYPVLSDANLDAIRHYDLVIAERAQDGHQAGGPGEFLIDSTGTVRWRKLVETHPPELLTAARVLQ